MGVPRHSINLRKMKGRVDLGAVRFRLFSLKKKNMPPFSGWGSLLWSLQIHYEETVKSLGVSVTHLIGLGRMKGSASLGATQWFMNPGPLDCKFSALTTRLLLHKTKYGLYIILKINFSIVLGSPILCMPIYEELILRNRNFWNLFPTNINWEQSPQIAYLYFCES